MHNIEDDFIIYNKNSSKCDMCGNQCNLGDCGNSISVWFPYGHALDGNHGRTLDDSHEFCSSECLIDYIILHEYTPDEVKKDMTKKERRDNNGSNI